MRQDIAVAVEDVVHDLEQEPELVAERAPSCLFSLRHLRRPKSDTNRRREQASRLEPVQRRLVGRGAGDVQVLPADHPQRRLRELPADERRRIRQRQPKRLCQQCVAGQNSNRLPVTRPYGRIAATDVVVVEGGQIVVDEREVVDELDGRGSGQCMVRLGTRCLGRGEADHRPHALAAHRERVAHGFRLAVQLRRERELRQVRLGELAELLSPVHPHRPPRPASRAAAPPPPSGSARPAP